MRANKGEWSELYVLLRLLAYGRLYSAGENTEKLEDVYFPIMRVLRNEGDSLRYEYKSKDDKSIELFINSDKISESIGNAADNVHTSIDLINDMINSIRCAGQC